MRVNILITSFIMPLLILTGCLSGPVGKKFTNDNVSPPGSSSIKYWRLAQLIDIGAVTPTSASANHDQNTTLPATVPAWRYPMAILNDAPASFYVIFNRADQPPTGVPLNVFAYVTGPVNFFNDLWTLSLGNFTQIDSDATVVSPGAESLRPIACIDGLGNITILTFTPLTEGATTYRRPLAVRRNATAGTWSIPSRITKSTETGDISTSAAVAADSNNNAVAIWVQNSKAYFNEYRPSMAWRFPAGSTSHTTFHSTAGGSVPLDLGMGLGFDSYGNGYAAYIASTGTFGRVMMVRWKGSTTQNWVTTDADTYQPLSTPGVIHDRFPRVVVLPGGATTVFFYRNFDTVSTAELWYATAPDTTSMIAATFSSASRFDSSVGIGNVVMVANTNDGFSPPVSVKGRYAAVAFIKSDGTTNRFYVSRYDSGNWTTPVAVDSAVGNVTWGDVAINESSQIAAVYSTLDVDGFEHVYAVNFSQGSWGLPTRIDTNTSTASVSATTKTRPSVSIDSSGQAIAVFSIPDDSAVFATPRRRAVGVIYR